VTTAAETRESTAGAAAGSWVFDADGHVVEPGEVWERHLPARFRSYAPRVLQEEDHFRYICNDRLSFRICGRAESVAAPGQTPHKEAVPVPTAGAADPVARLSDMDTDAIDVTALYPTYGLMIGGVTERAPALALCRAVNDWMACYCEHRPDRLVGVGVLPLTDADDALAEARRCVEELGFKGVWRRPEQFAGIPHLHDSAYEPLWGYLAEAGVPLAFHPGVSGLIPYDYLKDRYGDYFSAIHAVHFPAEQMMALTTMVAYGILQRHPKLKVAFLESGAAWIVPYLHRLDEHLETFGFDRGGLTIAPSELFGRQCFVSAEEPEPGLALTLERYPQSVVFASDYPHADGTFPGSTARLLDSDELRDDALRRVMRDNALHLYGMETPSRA
jgi:predicted TIM-barrel fold metal-dependent hydrolase